MVFIILIQDKRNLGIGRTSGRTKILLVQMALKAGDNQ